MSDDPKKPIRERLAKPLDLARSIGPVTRMTTAEEKRFMDELWEGPGGDFSLIDIEAIDLGKPAPAKPKP